MAKYSIPCLVGKPNKSGTNWYWQPSRTLADAGFKSIALGRNHSDAMAAAIEINAQVEAWRQGGDLPNLRGRHKDGTLGAAIDRYRRDYIRGTNDRGLPRIGPKTAKTYETALKRLEKWAGRHPLAYITRPRVIALRKGMMKPRDQGGVGHHAAHNTLKIGRQLFQFLIDEGMWEQGRNPFEKFGLAAPPPRAVVWSPTARERIVAKAGAMGFHSVALAIMLGYATAQREQDLLALTIPQYAAIPEHLMQPEDYATLSAASPDGVPRGLRVHQLKTKAWVDVPLTGKVREKVEAAIRRARAAGQLRILSDDTRSGIYDGPSGQTRFQRDFAAIREATAEQAEQQQEHDLAEEIRTLEFRDLRRTCVVYLGELGLDAHLIAAITGHDIDETQQILKTYMPRTTGRAARAIALATAREAKEAEKEKKP